MLHSKCHYRTLTLFRQVLSQKELFLKANSRKAETVRKEISWHCLDILGNKPQWYLEIETYNHTDIEKYTEIKQAIDKVKTDIETYNDIHMNITQEICKQADRHWKICTKTYKEIFLLCGRLSMNDFGCCVVWSMGAGPRYSGGHVPNVSPSHLPLTQVWVHLTPLAGQSTSTTSSVRRIRLNLGAAMSSQPTAVNIDVWVTAVARWVDGAAMWISGAAKMVGNTNTTTVWILMVGKKTLRNLFIFPRSLASRENPLEDLRDFRYMQ